MFHPILMHCIDLTFSFKHMKIENEHLSNGIGNGKVDSFALVVGGGLRVVLGWVGFGGSPWW